MKIIFRLLGISTDFQQLFFENEFKTLAGDKKKVIGVLVLIFFLTFMALGFALGSIENLQSKMDNPFTNWVDLPITAEVENSKSKIFEDFGQQENLDKFNLDNIAGSKRFYIEINKVPLKLNIGREARGLYGAWGYTLAADDKLVEQIFENEENVIWKSTVDPASTINYESCNVVISASLAEKLGYNNLNKQGIGGIVAEFDKTSAPIYLNVAAVVEALPKSCDFICTPQLYNILEGKTSGSTDCASILKRNGRGTNAITVLLGSNVQIDDFSKEFFNVFNEEAGTHRLVEDISIGATSFQIVEFYMENYDLSEEDIERRITALRAKSIHTTQLTSLKGGSDWCEELNEYYNIAFNFTNLDEIRNFKNHMIEKYKVEIDMSQIESAENFNLVTKLTTLISLTLLVFAVLSIMLFVQNLLSSHLFKIRSKLGTFKAFGMSNHELNVVYLKIIFSFLALGIVIALTGVVGFDLIESARVEESKFKIIDGKTFAIIVAILLISLFMSYRTIKKILGDTPGNLIYER